MCCHSSISVFLSVIFHGTVDCHKAKVSVATVFYIICFKLLFAVVCCDIVVFFCTSSTIVTVLWLFNRSSQKLVYYSRMVMVDLSGHWS